MQDGKVELQLPGVDLAATVRALISAHIGAALIGSEDAVKAIVGTVLQQRVGNDGTTRDVYNARDGVPYVEWLAYRLIREAATAMLKARVEALAPEIEAAMAAELRKNAKGIAKTLVAGFVEQCKAGYSIRVSVEGRER